MDLARHEPRPTAQRARPSPISSPPAPPAAYHVDGPFSPFSRNHLARAANLAAAADADAAISGARG
ncbi:hypothetical protein [Kribbella sp. NPDC050470]|uniref:hypothetical protein n=1 Tax=unclassified Kribbella TaxID=2644121 RepID=UPI0037B2215F